jgi:hypothetical protein
MEKTVNAVNLITNGCSYVRGKAKMTKTHSFFHGTYKVRIPP